MDADLKLVIVDIVRAKFTARHITEFFDQERMLDQWADYIYDTIAETTEFKKLLDSSPPYPYSRVINDFDIETVAEVSLLGAFGVPHSFTMNLSTPKPWVDFTATGDLKPLVRLESTLGGHPRLALLEHPKWTEFYEVVIAHNNVIKTSAEALQKLVTFVERVCDCYDTLNEALAAWPALRYLLPEKLQTEEFPFDGEPKPLPEGVDVAELTAMVVREKLEV